MRIQQIANLSVVFSFMKAHVKIVSIGPQDILEGDEKRILGLIWTLIEHFAVIMINSHLQTDIGSYTELKETLMLWARHKVDIFILDQAIHPSIHPSAKANLRHSNKTTAGRLRHAVCVRSGQLHR